MSTQIIIGDCRDVLRTLPDASVDSVVTDPPYELGFMGKAWDSTGIAYDLNVWRECLRVLKPGGHLLAFGGSRTYHRLACAIEDAGFEVRDQIMWLYGSGFPKSKNLDGEWQGWGTALKPAHEPIVVARKPLIGTVAANVLEHGTGALNIDGCRVEATGETITNHARGADSAVSKGIYGNSSAQATHQTEGQALGRWPANVIHDGSEEVLAAFPHTESGQPSGVKAGRNNNVFVQFAGGIPVTGFGDSGSAARFFYCAKASRKDRNEGCEGLEPKLAGCMNMRNDAHAQANGLTCAPKQNTHPTVKPTELMRYLCRLVTPPGGTVLDPFAGSGSTGRAANIEGFDAILIELNAEYAAIAQRRIAGDAPLLQGAAR